VRKALRLVWAMAALAAWLAHASAASAHAYLVKTVPAASEELNTPPATIQLTYDEPVEPRCLGSGHMSQVIGRS
jgi:methionine-rich copper-binding protein CopC